MRVGIIQSNYIPWRGYFDFINSVDLFVLHDDLQYTKGDWRNRNKIKTSQGTIWLTVPVRYHAVSQLICETEIDYSQRWQATHLNQFRANYFKASFFEEAISLLKMGLSSENLTIAQLNVQLIKSICSYLEIRTPIVLSQDFGITGTKTEKLINLLQKFEATVYLSGASAQAYIDENSFQKAGIGLEYKTYDYAPYNQLWGEFVGAVSILDLIANNGKEAKRFLTSQSPNIVAVETSIT